MDSTLFINPIMGFNRQQETVVENILLNASRVQSWHDNADDETLFYYKFSSKDSVRLKSQYPILQFETIFSETEANKFIVVNVTEISKRGTSYTRAANFQAPSGYTKIRIQLDEFVYARTIGSYQYVWITKDDGHFICVKTSDTLAEINGTASSSGSLP